MACACRRPPGVWISISSREPLTKIGLFVEMKTKVGVVSKVQSCLASQLNAEGYLCVIARSADEGFKIIEEYLG